MRIQGSGARVQGAKGGVIARSVEALDSPNNIMTRRTALDETVRP